VSVGPAVGLSVIVGVMSGVAVGVPGVVIGVLVSGVGVPVCVGVAVGVPVIDPGVPVSVGVAVGVPVSVLAPIVSVPFVACVLAIGAISVPLAPLRIGWVNVNVAIPLAIVCSAIFAS